MLYGIYQGILLVTFRQWERLRTRFNLSTPFRLDSLLSWLVTFAAISLGWILFRAESKAQAASMFRSVLSPASYARHQLPHNYYRMILLTGFAYFAVVWSNVWLDRLARPEDAGRTALDPSRFAGTMGILARNRWVWVVPLVAILSLYLLLLLPLEGPLIGPMLYQIF
jgi:hypothetical protein